jgi:undecaprenyl pyrophosphate phosphatase UppP
VVSAVFGVAAIAGLLSFVRTRTYRPFAIYRIVLGVAIIAIAMFRR